MSDDHQLAANNLDMKRAVNSGRFEQIRISCSHLFKRSLEQIIYLVLELRGWIDYTLHVKVICWGSDHGDSARGLIR